MSITGGVVIYFICWWLFFIMALPFGAEPDAEPMAGCAESAPAKPRLAIKALAASVLALVATLALHFALTEGWLAIELEKPR